MFTGLRNFIGAVLKEGWEWLAGSGILAILGLVDSMTNGSVPLWLWVGVVALGVFIAQFKAWQKINAERDELKKWKSGCGLVVTCKPGDPYHAIENGGRQTVSIMVHNKSAETRRGVHMDLAFIAGGVAKSLPAPLRLKSDPEASKIDLSPDEYVFFSFLKKSPTNQSEVLLCCPTTRPMVGLDNGMHRLVVRVYADQQRAIDCVFSVNANVGMLEANLERVSLSDFFDPANAPAFPGPVYTTGSASTSLMPKNFTNFGPT